MKNVITKNFKEKETKKTEWIGNEIGKILNLFPSKEELNGKSNYLLSLDEEKILSNLVQDWEKAKIEIGKLAINIFIVANKWLVRSIANRFSNWKKPSEDFIQEWTMGVIRATKTFDGTIWNKFSTYATWWIKQHIIKFLQEDRPIHISSQLSQDIFTFRKILYDYNLKLSKLSEKDIDNIVSIWIYNKKYIMKLLKIINSENLLSMDWENEEWDSMLHNTLHDGKNSPEETYLENQTNKETRDELENLLLNSKKSGEKRQWIILAVRNNIYWLNEKIIELLVELTMSNDILTIEKIPAKFIKSYIKNKDKILKKLNEILEGENDINDTRRTFIVQLCQKIIYMEDNMDLIINEFRSKNTITIFLFCILESYDQKTKTIPKVSLDEFIENAFLKKDYNITKYYNFIKKLLFLYSSKITGENISEKELKDLYEAFIEDMKTRPTLQDLWLLFSVSRERVRQLEIWWTYKFKAHMLRKKKWWKKPEKNTHKRLEMKEKYWYHKIFK